MTGNIRCHGRVRTDEKGNIMTADGKEGLGRGVFGADDLERAYAIPNGNAEGTTVAVLSMGDYASAESDLRVYRSAYGLPPCTTANGCFKKINPDGQAYPLPGANGDPGELMLDLDMVSAGCPDCRIIVAEANADWSRGDSALAKAEQMGALVITMSFGWGEPSNASADQWWLNAPGVSAFASSGDNGYGGPTGIYPATSPYVTGVGGTELTLLPSTSRGFVEEAWTSAPNAWGASTSACSGVFPKPAWQGNTGCSTRASADVSAAALGIAMYLSPNWETTSGTSASAPLVAGIFAETRHAGAAPSYSYGMRGSFHDIIWGLWDNSNCYFDPTTHARSNCPGSAVSTVGPGWDGPTGNGTPDGTKLAAGYWSSIYKNSFEGFYASEPGSNASMWWFAGTAGIDIDAGFAIPGEQNDGWVNASSGWNAVNTWLPTTAGQTCDVAIWTRTSQDNFGTGYISVNNEANSQFLGGTGAFGVLPGDSNFAGYQRMNFSFVATDTREIFYAGFWGNGSDSWMQLDDLSMKCRPQLQPFQFTDYQTGVGLYAHGAGFANGPVHLYYRGFPGQSPGWQYGATLQAVNNQIAGMDYTFANAYVNSSLGNAQTCSQAQASGYGTAIAIDSAGNESTAVRIPVREFCASVTGG